MMIPGQPSHASNGDESKHRHPDQHTPCSGEEIAEALSDSDPEVAVERVEDNLGRLPGGRSRSRIGVGARQRRDEEGPAGKPEELHDCGEDADNDRRRHDGDVVAGEHLTQRARRAGRTRQR